MGELSGIVAAGHFTGWINFPLHSPSNSRAFYRMDQLPTAQPK